MLIREQTYSPRHEQPRSYVLGHLGECISGLMADLPRDHIEIVHYETPTKNQPQT